MEYVVMDTFKKLDQRNTTNIFTVFNNTLNNNNLL